jgi:hypothetical protein
MPASATEATSTLSFDDHRYNYEQTISDIPLCPSLLDTLYSMDTLRELMSYADRIIVRVDRPNAKVIGVEFGVLGIRGSVDYLRELDPGNGTMRIRMLSHDEGGILPYPSAFEAGYLVTHDATRTTVVYTQQAELTARISMPYRVFIRAQMSHYGDKLARLIGRSCP